MNLGKDKSKVRHLIDNKKEWNAGIRPKYMQKLSREKASMIFKARTRMIDVKNNFRNKSGKGLIQSNTLFDSLLMKFHYSIVAKALDGQRYPCSA